MHFTFFIALHPPFLPNLLIVNFLLCFSVKSLPAKNKNTFLFCFFGLSCGQINEPEEAQPETIRESCHKSFRGGNVQMCAQIGQ